MNDNVIPIRLGGVFDTMTARRQAGAIWDTKGICTTIDTAQGGWRTPLIVVEVPDNE